MTHSEIVASLATLQQQIGTTDLPFVPFGRIVEAMVDLSEHSTDPLIHSMYDDLSAALRTAENAGPLHVVDADPHDVEGARSVGK